MARRATAVTTTTTAFARRLRSVPQVKKSWGETVDQIIENTRGKTAAETLRNRREAFNIPRLPFSAKFDRVILFRLNQEKLRVTRDQKTASGRLYVPQEAAEKNISADPRAVLIGAGLKARDVFRGHDIQIGDIVWPARFAGWEPDVVSLDPSINQGRGTQLLFVLDGDIAGSYDSLWREENGVMEIVLDPDGRHRYRHIDSKHRFDTDALVKE